MLKKIQELRLKYSKRFREIETLIPYGTNDIALIKELRLNAEVVRDLETLILYLKHTERT